jgi:T-complex protein 1 subunit epsilon
LDFNAGVSNISIGLSRPKKNLGKNQGSIMSLAFDEYGRPFLILKEQDSKIRLSGLEALKSHISIARAISDTMKTSLGPSGMDKILINPDGDISITNDGATILKGMHIDHEVGRLFVDLSHSQDQEIGDGTTSVVVFAGSLLEQSEILIDKGIHPLKIAEGFDKACKMTIDKISDLSIKPKNKDKNREMLISAAATCLNSKVISNYRNKFAELAVDSVLAVYEESKNEVNLDMINIIGQLGEDISKSKLINGVVLNKEVSHPQMSKNLSEVKIAILNCPFEPPRPKTKHKLDILTGEDLKKLKEYEFSTFEEMISKIKNSGCNLVLCQWGFDDEANYLLLKNDITAVRWVMGNDIEIISRATNGQIISRFTDLDSEKLGMCKYFKEMSIGNSKENFIVLEGCPNNKAITVVLYASSEMLLAETKRSFHDALCVIKNLVLCDKFVPGGGAVEIFSSLFLQQAARDQSSLDSLCFSAFSSALERIPECLVINCGLNPIEIVSQIKSLHNQTKNDYIGFNCLTSCITNMIEEDVLEPYVLKKHVYLLATQLVRMILKIDDVIHCKEL